MRPLTPSREGGRRALMRALRCLPAALLVIAVPVRAQAPLTLADALREARAHNATLPVAAYDTSIAAAALGAARGRLGPSVGLAGDVHGGAPSQYASGDARLQLAGELPIYDGGRLRAGVHQAELQRAVSAARFHVARRDLDFQVTAAFSLAVELRDELALGERGLDRLRRYLELIAARRASGQPVVGDLLKAQVERDRQAADTAETRRQLAGALLQLKELLGRSPGDTLVPAPLPAPAPPAPAGAQPWVGTPDVAAAEAARESARAGIAVVEADRRPHLDLAANVGAQPLIGSSFEAPFNTGRGRGGEALVSLSWPLWDHGVYRHQLAAARLAFDQSVQAEIATRREARSEWYQARTDLTHLYAVVRLREQAVPDAEDSYLQMESLYRGGAGNALEVLDAYTQWIQAGLDAARGRLAYRLAEARAQRWGGGAP
jgi:outer membrane protein